MKRLAAVLVVLALIGGAVAWFVLPERSDAPPIFLGYVEAETVLAAPKRTGRLASLSTREGDVVSAGDTLFTLDTDDERAAVAEASAQLQRARAQLADLQAARQRPPEIEALEARRRQAEAALELSRSELARQQRLFDQRVVAKARLDEARTAYRRDQSALAEIERQIEAAGLSGREDEIEAAKAQVDMNAAALDRARVALDERTVAAPQGGRVLDTFFRVGEIVTAGQPVAEILPPENVLVRFYVPEPSISGLEYGQEVAIACDGCPPDLTGRISFIASETEFTPPVIFSRQERAKLVFKVEAHPTRPTPHLKPGMPVEVHR